MTDAGRRSGFTRKTKPGRFVTGIALLDDFQCHGTVKIDVYGFVSDLHRTPAQLNRFHIFALHQFIVLKSSGHLFRGKWVKGSTTQTKRAKSRSDRRLAEWRIGRIWDCQVVGFAIARCYDLQLGASGLAQRIFCRTCRRASAE